MFLSSGEFLINSFVFISSYLLNYIQRIQILQPDKSDKLYYKGYFFDHYKYRKKVLCHCSYFFLTTNQ